MIIVECKIISNYYSLVVYTNPGRGVTLLKSTEITKTYNAQIEIYATNNVLEERCFHFSLFRINVHFLLLIMLFVNYFSYKENTNLYENNLLNKLDNQNHVSSEWIICCDCTCGPLKK